MVRYGMALGLCLIHSPAFETSNILDFLVQYPSLSEPFLVLLYLVACKAIVIGAAT